MTLDFTNTLAKLLVFWKRQGLVLPDGLAEYQIVRLEKAVDFFLEQDFREYLQKIDGFEDFASDSEFISSWSADRIRKELNDCHPKTLVCFADYCINLCSFGYHRVDQKIHIHYQHSENTAVVAGSFAEFIQLYLKNSDSLIIDIPWCL